MTRDGLYDDMPRFVMKNVTVSEGVHRFSFHAEGGSENAIRIYGVTKYEQTQTKYANDLSVALRKTPQSDAAAALTVPMNTALTSYGEIDVSKTEGYEYVLYDDEYYFVEKDAVQNEALDMTPGRILTPADGDTVNVYAGEKIIITWTAHPGADYYKVSVKLLDGIQPKQMVLPTVKAGEELRVEIGYDLLESYLKDLADASGLQISISVQAYAY